jgi:hypothetical protein
VVVIRPCSNKLVTRFRSVARRCDGLRPSFDPELRCRIVYPFTFCCLEDGPLFEAGREVFLSFSAVCASSSCWLQRFESS